MIGDSRTGEMDKVDGPYYFFKAIQKARNALPQWFPLIGPEVGSTNLVPVDYVAAAMDEIAHQDGLDGRAFHLADAKMVPSGEALNHFAKAAHAPQLVMRIDSKLLDALPKGVLSMVMQLPQLKDVRRAILADFHIPDEIVDHVGFNCSFDTRDTEQALEGTGIEVPPLPTYAEKIWDYWERNLDPDLFKDRSLRAAVNGKTVVITGASSGIGRVGRAEDRRGRRDPAARRARDREARGGQGRDRGRRRHVVHLHGGPLRHGRRSTTSSSGCSPTTRRST